MANIETGRTNIGLSVQIARKFSTGVLGHTILRAETTDSNHSIDKTRELLKNGYGLIVIINHWSLKDPPIIIDELFRLEDFRNRMIVVPIAYHMDSSILRKFFKINGVTSKPIVTENTVTKGKNNGRELNDGMIEYLDESIKLLKNGGIVVMAPQGTRMSHLGEPNKTTVGTFMAKARGKGLENYAFLIVGLGIKDVDNYSKKSGLNLLNKYTVKFGPCLTGEEVLTEAEKMAEKSEETLKKFNNPLRFVDKIIYNKLRPLLPPNLQ